MKKILLNIIIPFIVCSVIAYICGSVASASFNIGSWPENVRVGIAQAYGVIVLSAIWMAFALTRA